MLGRRNLGLGFGVFVLLLMVCATAVALPANLLGPLQGFRIEQSAPIGLMVGLPQLALGAACESMPESFLAAGQCSSGACSDGVCATRLADGSACTASVQCASENCDASGNCSQPCRPLH